MTSILTDLSNIFLQYLGVSGLGIAKVHQLIQQLVADDEVVSDALLLHLLEVLPHHLADPVQQTEHHGHVGVVPGGGHHVDVAVLDVPEGALLGPNQRTHHILLLHVSDQTNELLDHTGLNVSAIVARYQHLPLHIQEIYRTTSHDSDLYFLLKYLSKCVKILIIN